jgi:putative ABC transport system ATP-binding protein
VRRRYGGQVIELGDWRSDAGERWLLSGPSGSGKTTAIHLLAGVLSPSEGRIVVCGQDLAALSGAALDRFRGRHVGIVFQRLHLIGALDVRRNLALARSLAGLPADEARIEEVLERLALSAKARSRPETLSGGEAQRLAIARAVLNRPALLLADEPTASLDDANAARVLDLLFAEAQSCGATLVVASHDARAAARFERRRELRP